MKPADFSEWPPTCAGCDAVIFDRPYVVEHEFGGSIVMSETFCSENCASNEMERRHDHAVADFYGG